jgi:hypothetical protein
MSSGRLRKWSVATSVAAAMLLALSVSAVAASAGTGSSSSSLVLQQLLNGQVQCVSPDATCSVVNLYGNDGVSPNPVAPGDVRTTTVQLLNAGTLAASSLTMTPGACQNQTLVAGVPTGDLCGTLTVTISCTTGNSTFSYGPQTLTTFGEQGTHTIETGLAPGASSTCRFTVTYPAGADIAAASVAGMTLGTQAITWTLTANEAPTPTPSPPTTPGAPAAVTPGPAAPSTVPGPLAVTGSYPLALALAGLALLVVGRVLSRLSRRRDHHSAVTSQSAA